MERGPAEKDSIMFGVCRGSGVWSQPEDWKDDVGLFLRKWPEQTLWPPKFPGRLHMAKQEGAWPRGKWG